MVRDNFEIIRKTIEQFVDDRKKYGEVYDIGFPGVQRDLYIRIINSLTREFELIDKNELKQLRNDLINSECNLNHVYLQLDEEREKAHKEKAREILGQVKKFLDIQTKTVNELSNSKSKYAIPESCRDCYNGSQENRIAELKRIAEKTA